MIERRKHVRFAVEAREPIRVAREHLRQPLERDVTIELRVSGAIDLAHAAFADFGDDIVRSEAAANRKGKGQRGGVSIREWPWERPLDSYTPSLARGFARSLRSGGSIRCARSHVANRLQCTRGVTVNFRIST